MINTWELRQNLNKHHNYRKKLTILKVKNQNLIIDRVYKTRFQIDTKAKGF